MHTFSFEFFFLNYHWFTQNIISFIKFYFLFENVLFLNSDWILNFSHCNFFTGEKNIVNFDTGNMSKLLLNGLNWFDFYFGTTIWNRTHYWWSYFFLHLSPSMILIRLNLKSQWHRNLMKVSATKNSQFNFKYNEIK